MADVTQTTYEPGLGDRGRPAAIDSADGRIPFRLRLGVTGHRHLKASPSELVFEQLDALEDRLLSQAGADRATEIELAVVSQLAEGADRLFVADVIEYARSQGREARLEVVLPMQREQYAMTQEFSGPSREEFERLLAAASFVIEPRGTPLDADMKTADVYETGSRNVLRRCDALVALWDGSAAGGKGGTADTLHYAAAHGKPCIWIPTDGTRAASNNLVPGSEAGFAEEVGRHAGLNRSRPSPDRAVLEEAAAELAALDEYNREPRPRRRSGASGATDGNAALGGLVDLLFDSRFARRFDRLVESQLDDERRASQNLLDAAPPSLLAPFVRADVLAGHYQQRFKRTAWVVLAAATVAAAALATSVGLRAETRAWPILELVALCLALICFLALRRFGLHARWLSYRVLAERLRAAQFIAPTGVDFRDEARLRGVWVAGRSEAWLTRAFEEVWDREPHGAGLEPTKLEQLKSWLATVWIGGQIDFHRSKAQRQRRLDKLLTRVVFLAFALTVLFALLDAILTGTDISIPLQRASQALTLFLPIAGASLGALLTVNQHRALAERSTRMLAELEPIHESVSRATDVEGLQASALAAAQVIVPEAGTWFGALWFLDIEHP